MPMDLRFDHREVARSPGSARIEIVPTTTGARVEYNGPWALFRLLDHSAVREAGSPARFDVVFNVGGRHASFEVEATVGPIPFVCANWSASMSDFRSVNPQALFRLPGWFGKIPPWGFCNAPPAEDFRRTLGRVVVLRIVRSSIRARRHVERSLQTGAYLVFFPGAGTVDDHTWHGYWFQLRSRGASVSADHRAESAKPHICDPGAPWWAALVVGARRALESACGADGVDEALAAVAASWTHTVCNRSWRRSRRARVGGGLGRPRTFRFGPMRHTRTAARGVLRQLLGAR